MAPGVASTTPEAALQAEKDDGTVSVGDLSQEAHGRLRSNPARAERARGRAHAPAGCSAARGLLRADADWGGRRDAAHNRRRAVRRPRAALAPCPGGRPVRRIRRRAVRGGGCHPEAGLGTRGGHWRSGSPKTTLSSSHPASTVRTTASSATSGTSSSAVLGKTSSSRSRDRVERRGQDDEDAELAAIGLWTLLTPALLTVRTLSPRCSFSGERAQRSCYCCWRPGLRTRRSRER